MTSSRTHRSAAMSRKIDRSSLGTPAARKLRARTPPGVTKRIVAGSKKR